MTRVNRMLIGAAVVIVSACGGSSDGGTSTSDAANDAVNTEPTATSAAEPGDTGAPGTAATEANTSDPATSDSEPPTTNSSEIAPTTSLVPSPSADLPTDAPSENAPSTTTPGPLPIPSVELIDVGTFERPVEIGARRGDGRLYVVEQAGKIIAADDESSVTVFDIANVSQATFTNFGNEQGLLGLAFHPERDLAYIHFTDGDGNTVLAELAIDADSGEFDNASYRVVLTQEQPFTNHNGGEVAFGPDGMLYLGLGDGGAADDPLLAGLDLSTRLGKILRIDPLATADAPFSVPDDNPFVGQAGADPTIWSYGLRNPWRFSFDSLTGDLWIGDVGQNRLEEIDLAGAVDGANAGRGVSFGWSAFEAGDRFNDNQPADGHMLPVVSYPHENGSCSVTGGVVARQSTFAELNGWYIYGDYCSGILWALDTTSVTATPDGPAGTPVIRQISTVGGVAAIVEGPFGDIYTVSNFGTVSRLAPA